MARECHSVHPGTPSVSQGYLGDCADPLEVLVTIIVTTITASCAQHCSSILHHTYSIQNALERAEHRSMVYIAPVRLNAVVDQHVW